jgi:methylmalonyl-CoA epimerase
LVKRFDHVTIAVRDLDRAKAFFGLLGFVEDKAVVISGPIFSAYMGVDGIEADHVTLVLAGAEPRLEVQILRYRRPDPLPDPHIERLDKLGFNHICFAVDDIEAAVRDLAAKGFRLINARPAPGADGKKIVFLHPDSGHGVLIELSEDAGGGQP